MDCKGVIAISYCNKNKSGPAIACLCCFNFLLDLEEITVKITFTASGWTGKRPFYQSKSGKKSNTLVKPVLLDLSIW